MENSSKYFSSELVKNNIRPSIQRIKVLEYLLKNPCHPSVDSIFTDLQSEIPTLSKTTIYNTLNLLIEAGLIKVLNIADYEARYDMITENHGHFKCDKCGTILNFNIDIDSFEAEDLNGFKVLEKNVYFKGVCPKCLLNVNKNKRKEQIS
jgi:Fur family transcriptional regulator, peroxide stress response regulator